MAIASRRDPLPSQVQAAGPLPGIVRECRCLKEMGLGQLKTYITKGIVELNYTDIFKSFGFRITGESLLSTNC